MLELSVEVCVNAQRLNLLVILDFGRALTLLGVLLLPHTDERSSVAVIATHDVPAWREHSLNLPVLTADHLASIGLVMNGALS